MQAEDIDIQLWAYIDSTCTPEEHNRVAKLIAQDEVWKDKYEELLAFHQSVQTDMRLEHINSSITDAVMAKIDVPATQSNSKSLLLTWGIRAIVAFFIISISAAFVYYIITADLSLAEHTVRAGHNFTVPQSAKPTIGMFVGFTVLIFLLMAVDNIFRRRMA